MPKTVPLYEIQKLTYEDYALIPDDGRRHEILDGTHVTSPAPSTRHQRTVGDLYAEMRFHVRGHGLGEVFVAPFDVLLSEVDIVQPDICFVADGRPIVDEANCKGAPDLMVEVLSPSTRRRDLIDKRLLFERFGVAEYWAVDPDADEVQVFRLGGPAGQPGGSYARTALRAESGDALTSACLPGFSLVLSEPFA